MAEITYEVQKNVGILSESSTGWRKEVKIISWNNNLPKYDIREWSPDGKKMGKGQTFTKEEMQILLKLIKEEDI